MSHPNHLQPYTRKRIHNYSYALSDTIGRGYSSTVYVGRDETTNHTVAIKVVRLASLPDSTARAMHSTQLNCLRTLNHPNILHFIDSFITAHNSYLVTEYCAHGDLARRIRQSPLNQHELYSFFTQIYDAYTYFFDARYIHRDIKPANIFLSSPNTYKIADFGFVKVRTSIEKETYNVGTPAYMAPQSLAHNIYNEKTEVWSLGITLYETLYGATPFRGPTQAAIKKEVNEGTLLFKEQGSHELKDFIFNCLRRNPSDRMSLSQMKEHPWMKKAYYSTKREIQSYIRRCPLQDKENKRASKGNTDSFKHFRSLQHCKRQPLVTSMGGNEMLNMNRILSMKKKKQYDENREECNTNADTNALNNSNRYTINQLLALINYFRYIYTTIVEMDGEATGADNKLMLAKLLLEKMLSKVMHMHIRATTTKENVFGLLKWEFLDWNVYQTVIKQYEKKYQLLIGEDITSQELAVLKGIVEEMSQTHYTKSYDHIVVRLTNIISLSDIAEKMGWEKLILSMGKYRTEEIKNLRVV